MLRCLPSVYFTRFNKGPIHLVSSHQCVPALWLPQAAGIPSWSLVDLQLNRFSVHRCSACSDVQIIYVTMILIAKASINSFLKDNGIILSWTPILHFCDKSKKMLEHKQKGGDLLICSKVIYCVINTNQSFKWACKILASWIFSHFLKTVIFLVW